MIERKNFLVVEVDCLVTKRSRAGQVCISATPVCLIFSPNCLEHPSPDDEFCRQFKSIVHDPSSGVHFLHFKCILIRFFRSFRRFGASAAQHQLSLCRLSFPPLVMRQTRPPSRLLQAFSFLLIFGNFVRPYSSGRSNSMRVALAASAPPLRISRRARLSHFTYIWLNSTPSSATRRT